MGNSTSNANANPPPNTAQSRLDSSSRRTASPIRGGSPAPSSHRVHKSLRQKKKSLELPDLASLALTPTPSSPSSGSPHAAYRRPRASSPIPIPNSANPPVQTFRVQNNLPSAAHINLHTVPSGQGRSRHNRSYLNSAYPSTNSFDSRVHSSPPQQTERLKPEFVPEVIHSTLPVALPKAEEDISKPEPITVFIKWRGIKGEYKSVVLARAGDDSWKGRQPMDFDPSTNVWTAPVKLLPGTHHFKFIVDDVWRISDDYPTAVDDLNGSLANYVNVTIPTSSSPQTPAYTSPLASPSHNHPNQFNSFWSDPSTAVSGAITAFSSPGSTPKGEAEWTTVIPPELVAAAQEEEVYLASADSPTSSSSVPAPNIPPAPVLPRHLDKLILNVRPSAPTGLGPLAGNSEKGERDRSRRTGSRAHRREGREGRPRPTSTLGMTSADGAAATESDGAVVERPIPPHLTLPVVTASGTDITTISGPSTPQGDNDSSIGSAKKVQVAKLDGAGLADDGSVLPVPSHVVLHHLSTSAIRNGVLAVANTTRYRKKYITTIYYKPT
ncbi:5'-AMP-activated protein kinase beta subunit, interation domain-containing protein [Abortiporus biennis]|nr:5'-AMP-activated protein kinase beta subunit, interation domain-containing protein [Abortiporus biennis]